MKIMPRLVIALAAAATCGLAAAQSISDQERRERNREEAIAKWERQYSSDSSMRREDMQPRDTVRGKTRHAAQKTRSFTHRQLQKMRRFGDRQDARHPGPENPTREPDKAPTALGK